MKTQSLNGIWCYRKGKGEWSTRKVPCSSLAVGHSEYRKTFVTEYSSPKVFLKLDGITYRAEVFLNGHHLGTMLPYSEYTYDISNIISKNENELLVELEDISPAFGPSVGWENFSGIIRPVTLIYTEESYIKDCFFHTKLTNNFKSAEYTLETDVNAPAGCMLEVALKYCNKTVDTFCIPADQATVTRKLTDVKLWSTDAPSLYTLEVGLSRDGSIIDDYSANVGFKEFKCDERRFYLNGKPLFLLGVCKHEMIGDSGHTPSVQAIEDDLLRIKNSGFNFVRLVHYPHCKQTLEIADRIGLLVCEEPGLWWSDTSNEEISAGSLEVLKRTVFRDRNHPSIAFWLCFNECRFTEEFLVRSAEVCHKLDPTRMVSGANCMSIEDTLKYYNICNFDFYTMHPYSDTFERSRESIEALVGKPLIFTEWGGFYLYDNPHLLTDFINEMYSYYINGSEKGALAGAFFWYWSEVHDFNRARPACLDGIMREALIDYNGKPTSMYEPFCKAWKEAISQKNEQEYYYRALLPSPKKPFVCRNESGIDELLQTLRTREPSVKEIQRERVFKYGPVLLNDEISDAPSNPYVLTEDSPLVFEGNALTDTVTLIGAVSTGTGYPISGEYGEIAAELTITLNDGTSILFPLRNGIEITTAFTTLASSRIEPFALNAVPFAYFGHERNHENYIINQLKISLSKAKTIVKAEIKTIHKDYELLFWGVYAD